MKPQGTQLSLFETRSTSEPFAVRVSARARRLTARVHVGGRVEIVVPVGVGARTVRDFVHRFTPWIDRKVAAMQSDAEPAAPVPARIDFPFSRERFAVDWQPASRSRISLHGGDLSLEAPDEARARAAAARMAQAGGRRASLARAHAARSGSAVLRSAGGDPLPAHALGQLFDARHGQPELFAGVPARRGGPLPVRARAGAPRAHESFRRLLAPGGGAGAAITSRLDRRAARRLAHRAAWVFK